MNKGLGTTLSEELVVLYTGGNFKRTSGRKWFHRPDGSPVGPKKPETEFLSVYLISLVMDLNFGHLAFEPLQCALSGVVLKDHLEAAAGLECSSKGSSGHT